MAGMIEMPPPPEPPELGPDKIRALIDYADKMAAFMEAETELVRELGRATPENNLSELIEGWRFTAQGQGGQLRRAVLSQNPSWSSSGVP